MKCTVIKMRSSGVAIPKNQLPKEPRYRGDVSISETKSDDLNRIVRMAKCIQSSETQLNVTPLYEPHLLWMHDDRFVLTGFERMSSGRGVVDYAQSWLCQIEPQ